jgi:hypothetical protein
MKKTSAQFTLVSGLSTSDICRITRTTCAETAAERVSSDESRFTMARPHTVCVSGSRVRTSSEKSATSEARFDAMASRPAWLAVSLQNACAQTTMVSSMACLRLPAKVRVTGPRR